MCAADVSEATHRFRENYRSQEIPRGYHPELHLLITFGVGVAALVACLWQLHDVRAVEWLTVPLAFIYAIWPSISGVVFRCTGNSMDSG